MLRSRLELWPDATALQTAPANEPVTVSEAKEHTRIDEGADDSLVNRLIAAARQHVESETGRALITQTWDAFYENFPARSGALVLPQPPLRSVSEVEFTDEDGATSTVAASKYNVDTNSEPGRIRLKRSETWPSDLLDTVTPVRVRFEAGYGARSDVPEGIKQAIHLLVAHWYENREALVIGSTTTAIERSVDALVDQHRIKAVA